jgi:RHS repeat-associated protein
MGGEQRGTSTLTTAYRYTGQRWESELQIYYYGARWYCPFYSRFTQPDSVISNP